MVASLPYSVALPEEHSGAALPLCSAGPGLRPVSVSGLEPHPGPVLVLQVPRPVGHPPSPLSQMGRWGLQWEVGLTRTECFHSGGECGGGYMFCKLCK